MQSKDVIRLRERFRALEAKERLSIGQVERLRTKTGGREIEKSRRSFIELFTTSKIGLVITNTRCERRDPSVQRACLSWRAFYACIS